LPQSELSRMRNFAFRFPTLDDLRQRYPDARTWSAVKELLPRLSEATSAPKQKSASVRVLEASLEKLTTKVKTVAEDLTEGGKLDLRKKIEEFATDLVEVLTE